MDLRTLASAVVLSALPALAHAETCLEGSNAFINPVRRQATEGVETVFVDPVYATSRNFTGEPLSGYAAEKVWIHPDALKILESETENVQGRLKALFLKKGMTEAQAQAESDRYFFLIKDAYRPYRATVAMNAYRNKVNSDTDTSNNIGSGWIAGDISNHNRGYTVDRTLVRKMEDGTSKEVWMGSRFDEFNPTSYLYTSKDSGMVVSGRSHTAQDDVWAYGGAYHVTGLETGAVRSALASTQGSEYWREWWHSTLIAGGACYDTPIQ